MFAAYTNFQLILWKGSFLNENDGSTTYGEFSSKYCTSPSSKWGSSYWDGAFGVGIFSITGSSGFSN